MARQARPHDRYMVQYGTGCNLKLATLSYAQRWVYVTGVLELAARSPIRGALLLSDATPIDDATLARTSAVSKSVASRARAKFHELEMLEIDKDFDFEWVHDFHLINPPQPSKSAEGQRQRKRAQRAREQLQKRLQRAA